MPISTVAEQREALVDWDAVDEMFRYLESAQGSERTMSGFAVSGFVAAAVMVDGRREPDAWWRPLLCRLPGHVPERVRNGFVANWLDVEARFACGRFAPVVSGPDEEDHGRTVADFCAGFVRALDERRDALVQIDAQPGAREALATLRLYATALAAAPQRIGGASVAPRIAAALRLLWAATADVRAQQPEVLSRRAA
jgi:hypothetical protein